MQKIGMVCFDLGGVIVKHSRTWAEGCAAAGLSLHVECDTPEASAARKGLAMQFTLGRVGEREFYEAMSRTTGGRYSPEQVAAIHHAWLGEEYEGVYEVVSRLVEMEGRGAVRTGVLSNTNAAHWARLEAVGEFRTPRLVRDRFASHLLGLGKPDPAIFRAFEERVGVAAGEILFFEDLPENVAAARSAGWNVVQVDYTGDTARQIGDALARYGVW